MELINVILSSIVSVFLVKDVTSWLRFKKSKKELLKMTIEKAYEILEREGYKVIDPKIELEEALKKVRALGFRVEKINDSHIVIEEVE